MQALRDLLQPERLTAIVDVGANQIDANPPYQRMLDEGLCTVVGFEPQPEALAKLIAGKGPSETYLPHAIGNGQVHTLHLTQHQGMVSFLEPDPQTVALFNGFPEWSKVVQLKPMATARLDDIEAVAHIDLLKADVQGYEIEVLRSARYKLAKAVAIQVEVAFIALYKDQPTFADVDMELRAMGFRPHCFAEAKVMPLANAVNPPHSDPHQLVDADVLYIRDITKPMDTEQWKHLALIAHHISGSFDLAMRCVAMAAKVGGAPADAPDQYRRILEAQ